MPVIAETYDGGTNDINGRHVKEEHVRAALDSAQGGHVAEGCTGGGTGMVCYGFKGGTGTSSRTAKIPFLAAYHNTAQDMLRSQIFML